MLVVILHFPGDYIHDYIHDAFIYILFGYGVSLRHKKLYNDLCILEYCVVQWYIAKL